MMPVVDGTTSSSRHEQLPVETDSPSNVRRTVTDPAGNMSETVEAFDGVTTATTPEGSTRTSTEGPDARFGIAAPVMTDATLGPPSSLTSTLIGGRSVELKNTGLSRRTLVRQSRIC